ncbi:MAG TPA: hypothetical protein VGH21_02110 [Solirubrobacteraceae bacterium]|jgi:hypothetical protein
MRKRITYANVVATLALVFAMSGGALAAKHYLVTSPKQISPKVLKSFSTTNTALFKKLSKTVTVSKASTAGKADSATTAGTAGSATTAATATNAANAANATKATTATTATNASALGGVSPSGYQTSVLATGETELGDYATWGSDPGYLGTSATFRIPLSKSLDSTHVHFIKEEGSSTPECPGKASAPAATSGNLCVYEAGVGGAVEQSIFPQGVPVDQGTDPYGFGIYFTAAGSGGVWDYGVYAVTG